MSILLLFEIVFTTLDVHALVKETNYINTHSSKSSVHKNLSFVNVSTQDEPYVKGIGMIATINPLEDNDVVKFPPAFIILLVPATFLCISILLWKKFGQDDPVIKTVEFYPPEGLNSLEVGFLYKGTATSSDVISLLIYLADKGYIQIVDTKIHLKKESSSMKKNPKVIELQNKIDEERARNPNSKKLKYYYNMLEIYKDIDKPIDYRLYGVKSAIKMRNMNSSDYLIRKVKDYDGDNVDLKIFMNGLFSYGRTEVTEDMLYHNFFRTVQSIVTRNNRAGNKAKVFRDSKKVSLTILTMILITILFLSYPLLFTYVSVQILLPLLFCQIVFSIIAYLLPGFWDRKSFVLWSVLFWIGLLGYFMYELLASNIPYLILYGIGGICLIGMLLCFKHMTKKTAFGNKMLGKILGFKDFLETAEKEKLEALVMEDPNYFYHILPYTYVLEVSDVWIKKFETIALDAPDWYDHASPFDSMEFSSFIVSTMKSAQNVMTSRPASDVPHSSSDDYGSSGGGGFSGGGSGGGGGGAW